MVNYSVFSRQGYEVHTQIGCSGYKIDLGIVHPDKPNEYILGILSDGKNYYASRTARDREIVQLDTLKLLGWTIQRVWSTEWWEKPAKTMSDIMEAIRLAKENSVKPQAASALSTEAPLNQAFSPAIATATTSAPSILGADPKSVKTAAIPYQICQVEIMLVSDSEEFFWLRHQDRIKAQIDQILSTESPISKSLLCKRVLMAWGIARLGSRINAYFESIFARMDIKTVKQENNIIFWKGNDPENYRSFRIARILIRGMQTTCRLRK